MSEDTSALYPPSVAGTAPAAWFSTLRTVLDELAAHAGNPGAATDPAARRPPTADLAETLDMSATIALDDSHRHDAPPAPADAETGPDTPTALADDLRTLSPEAADVPEHLLEDLLHRHRAQISTLADTFGLEASALLTALGRGLVPGELDPIAAAAVTAGVPGLRGVISSGSIAVERAGRATTLIAAATVGAPLGPVRLTDEYWERHGLPDVWLCAVAADPDPLGTARSLFERILPQAGVLRAHLRASGRRRLHVGLQAVAPDADPDLVMGRLEGWRSAVGQLSSGFVDIVWEQA